MYIIIIFLFYESFKDMENIIHPNEWIHHNTPSMKNIIQTLQDLDSFYIYNNNGNAVFKWNLAKLLENIEAFNFKNIGNISSNNKTVFRFGANNDHGFIDRNILKDFARELAYIWDEIERKERRQKQLTQLKQQESRSQKIDKIKEAMLLLYINKKNQLSDEAFGVGHWMLSVDDVGNITTYERIDGNIGIHYDAHGIAKTNQLENLLNILTNWIDNSRTFYSAPFEIPKELKQVMWPAMWTSWTAYKDGIAVLVSWYKKSLKHDGIKYIFLNDTYKSLLEPLKNAFPEKKFYLLSEQKEVLEKDFHESIQ